jgi:hypothetical protein
VPALAALAFTGAALAVAFAPHRPLDVSASTFPRSLPAHLGRMAGEAVPLSEKELGYFASFGGAASKRVYRAPGGRSHAVLLVTSSAPLRHLHDPEDCLRGAGYSVARLGVRPGAVPTVLWRAVGPDGLAWRVEASLISDAGQTASSLSEVIWLWMSSPRTAWHLVERVTPWPLCEADPRPCRAFDRSLFAALDLSVKEVPQ